MGEGEGERRVGRRTWAFLLDGEAENRSLLSAIFLKKKMLL